MTNTQAFAICELEILSKSATEPDNRPIIEPFIPEILALAEKFGLSGQSGGSAPYTATAISQAIKKLLLQEPIMPMTGIDDEWINVAEYAGPNEKEVVWQNKRCSALFKNVAGTAYYLDAIIWKDERKFTYTGNALDMEGRKVSSRQVVKSFPFTPKTFYIDVISKEIEPDNWEFCVKYPRQLEKVWKHYTRF